MLAASEPDSFSDKPKAMSLLPRAISGRKRFFWSSVPDRMIGNDPRALTA